MHSVKMVSPISYSILDLLSLGLQLGDEVEISVTGPQEAEACGKIAELFATEFDFV